MLCSNDALSVKERYFRCNSQVFHKTHYLDLPSISWDQDGGTRRGFTRNRFSSNVLFKQNTELIFLKMAFGAVFFTNISSVSKLDPYQFNKWHSALGTGLRIKRNKKNRVIWHWILL